MPPGDDGAGAESEGAGPTEGEMRAAFQDVYPDLIVQETIDFCRNIILWTMPDGVANYLQVHGKRKSQAN